MKTVITYGTFDLLHVGHTRLLWRLRKLADRVVVGCSTDAFNNEKGKQTIMSFEQREEMLASIRYVDKVIPENGWEQKEDDIKRENAHIFAIGEDWAGEFDYLADLCEVIYLPRTNDISTTSVRQMVHSLHEENISELRHAAHKLNAIIDKL